MSADRILLPQRDASGNLVNLVVEHQGRRLALLGQGDQSGSQRELALLHVPGADALFASSEDVPPLPVLLGSGLGYALDELLRRTTGPVAVVDKEIDMLALTAVRERTDASRVFWITDADHESVLKQLAHWQQEHGGKPLFTLVNTFYSRLDRVWYQTVRDGIDTRTATPSQPDDTSAPTAEEAASRIFWDRAVQPRFTGSTPRVLLITSNYFLMGEVVGACRKLNIPHLLLTLESKELGGVDFVKRLLKAVLAFRPDCVLTMNHLGVDREGVLVDLLARLELPLASWFVDNPQLILHSYQNLINPWTALFTWDQDNLPLLREQGYQHVFYVPLGTEPDRFRPRRPSDTVIREGKLDPKLFPAPVSFVGNSMVYKVAHRLRAGHFTRPLLLNYRKTAAAYSALDERSVQHFLREYAPDIRDAYDALPAPEDRLAYEAMLTWEATRQYRTRCVEQILPFDPVIVGDKGWFHTLKSDAHCWRRHQEVSYYEGLPSVYRFSAINFNCTSKQMKGAVNQRVFDVPAAGAFVLTDWREQMDALFEPDKEVISYREPEEIGELVRYYLKHPAQRMKRVKAARRRILAEHTWGHRLRSILDIMQRTFGTNLSR